MPRASISSCDMDRVMMETGDDWILVSRVGRPVNRVFPVHFVRPDDDCEDAEAREALGRSLDYYFVELGEGGSWAYARSTVPSVLRDTCKRW